MTFRKICSDYCREIIFGVVLFACVLLSYYFARYIPLDFFDSALAPIMNGCIASVSIFGAILLFRHHEGVHVRILWACVLLVWALFISMILTHKVAFNIPFSDEDTLSLHGLELFFGNIFAWVLIFYPTAVLRPGYLNVHRALIPFIPVALVTFIDWYFDIDLSWLLAIIPVLWISRLAVHIRKYREWCEENYSSMEHIDVRWIWRYITMYLISGIAYIVLSFSYTPAHAFTQQWLLLFMLAYSTEQILYRQDPWELLRKAKNGQKAVPVIEEEVEENENVQETEETMQQYAEYKAALDTWMETEKPYLNTEFRLLDLQQVVPVNRTYLSRFLKAEYGCNFCQLVTNYRIEEAKRIMRENPEIKMQDVGEQSGFSSPTVFARIFSREVGTTPREWSASQNAK